APPPAGLRRLPLALPLWSRFPEQAMNVDAPRADRQPAPRLAAAPMPRGVLEFALYVHEAAPPELVAQRLRQLLPAHYAQPDCLGRGLLLGRKALLALTGERTTKKRRAARLAESQHAPPAAVKSVQLRPALPARTPRPFFAPFGSYAIPASHRRRQRTSPDGLQILPGEGQYARALRAPSRSLNSSIS